MKVLFSEPELQKAFEETLKQYESFREVIARKIDITNPTETLSKLSDIQNVQSMAATCKAKLGFLLEKYTVKKLRLIDENKGAMEKKAQLSAEVGDLSFWDNVCELLIKEMHYQIDILRSALSYHKSEMNNL
jgi:hypothetical protein